MNEHCRGCIRYLKSCSGMSKAVCEKHKLRIPRTNADRIRAMSDEELAVFMAANQGVTAFDGSGDIYNRWLDWLKEEVR